MLTQIMAFWPLLSHKKNSLIDQTVSGIIKIFIPSIQYGFNTINRQYYLYIAQPYSVNTQEPWIFCWLNIVN